VNARAKVRERDLSSVSSKKMRFENRTKTIIIDASEKLQNVDKDFLLSAHKTVVVICQTRKAENRKLKKGEEIERDLERNSV